MCDKNKKLIIGLIILFMSLILVSCDSLSAKTYRYEVSGSSGRYSITIENVDGNTQQWAEVGNEWAYEWTQTGERWLYVSAQNQNDYGSVTVLIKRDGKTVSTNTSYGAYVIATASGTY